MSWQSTPTWHLDETTLRAYVDGHPLSVVGASVESHLARVPRLPGAPRRADVARDRRPGLDRDPRARRGAAAQRRRAGDPPVGISIEVARLLVAVPAFRGAWLLGLFVVTLFAGLAALFAGEYGLTLFLIVAPLAPVAGVAASFGGDADPCHELVTVTPLLRRPHAPAAHRRGAGHLAPASPCSPAWPCPARPGWAWPG